MFLYLLMSERLMNVQGGSWIFQTNNSNNTISSGIASLSRAAKSMAIGTALDIISRFRDVTFAGSMLHTVCGKVE